MRRVATVTVKCCKEYPFFQAPPMTVMSALVGVNLEHGFCGIDPDDSRFIPAPEVPRRVTGAKMRVFVEDRNVLPTKCPLRITDVIVALGS